MVYKQSSFSISLKFFVTCFTLSQDFSKENVDGLRLGGQSYLTQCSLEFWGNRINGVWNALSCFRQKILRLIQGMCSHPCVSTVFYWYSSFVHPSVGAIWPCCPLHEQFGLVVLGNILTTTCSRLTPAGKKFIHSKRPIHRSFHSFHGFFSRIPAWQTNDSWRRGCGWKVIWEQCPSFAVVLLREWRPVAFHQDLPWKRIDGIPVVLVMCWIFGFEIMDVCECSRLEFVLWMGLNFHVR